jgi:hypothetical protein
LADSRIVIAGTSKGRRNVSRKSRIRLGPTIGSEVLGELERRLPPVCFSGSDFVQVVSRSPSITGDKPEKQKNPHTQSDDDDRNYEELSDQDPRRFRHFLGLFNESLIDPILLHSLVLLL